MKHIVLALSLMYWLNSAFANCMQTFNVKQNAEVSDYTWIPGVGSFSSPPISCVALEKSRQRLFVSAGGKIDSTFFASAVKYEAELTAISKRIANAKSDLDNKLANDAAIDAVRVSLEIILYDLGKAMTLIGCFAPEPTMLSKFGCGVGLISTAKDTHSILSGNLTKKELSDRAKKLTGDINTMEKARAALIAKKAQFKMDASSKQLNLVFLQMCEAVQKSCL